MFFKVIYYLIGLFIVFFNFYRLNDMEFMGDLFDLNKKSKELKAQGEKFDYDSLDDDFKHKLYWLIGVAFLALVWFAIGLFSYNWFLFLAYFVASFILGKINPNVKKNKTSFLAVTKTQIVLGISVILFAIINTFHLHIDFIKLIFGA